MKLQAAKKGSSIILLALLVASIFLLPQSASAYSKPSTPEFTARYVDYSYYVAPVYGTDEFTGQTVVKQEGRTVDGKTVELTMKNQPFTTYNDSDGNVIDLYFNFRYKGHYGANWTHYPFSENGYGTKRYGNLFYSFTDEVPQISQSNTAFTTKNLTLAFLYGVYTSSVDGQIDFQVQAMIGHIDYAGDGYYKFVGQAGDWSSTQTITIGETAPAVTQTPTTAPIQPSTVAPTYTANSTISGNEQNFTLDWQTTVIAILVTAVAALIVIVAVLFRKNRTQKGGFYQ